MGKYANQQYKNRTYANFCTTHLPYLNDVKVQVISVDITAVL